MQNLTFANGHTSGADPGGGGAIFVRGGRFKIVNCRFFNNRCDDEGPDVGGAAVRVISQYDNQPVYVVGSTFGGREDLRAELFLTAILASHQCLLKFVVGHHLRP